MKNHINEQIKIKQDPYIPNTLLEELLAKARDDVARHNEIGQQLRLDAPNSSSYSYGFYRKFLTTSQSPDYNFINKIFKQLTELDKEVRQKQEILPSALSELVSNRLFSPITVTKPKETYCGFKSGFLIGRSL